MNSCISSVWTIFNKMWKDSVSQVSPIRMDNTARPPKRDEEWTITVKDTQAMFLNWRTNYWILCSLSVLERYYCAGKDILALGCQCKVFAATFFILSLFSLHCGATPSSVMDWWYYFQREYFWRWSLGNLHPSSWPPLLSPPPRSSFLCSGFSLQQGHLGSGDTLSCNNS